MTDTVKLLMEQIDEDNSTPISRVTVEWFGSDRNVANMLSMAIVQGVVDKVKEGADAKLEATASDEVKQVLGIAAAAAEIPKGAIR